uniref:Uncharacterized protein n=1 Tax=Grammatophora oceanica TaxID=210454 RepID=A0A7S1VRL1_9STRA|mmetsp:Transcript_54237/g.80928  ORF Transcript_54237/g.80928 Transcript_54237/m.80928 type:complete len:331 (+) Transcript_54237:147-1139(+)
MNQTRGSVADLMSQIRNEASSFTISGMSGIDEEEFREDSQNGYEMDASSNFDHDQPDDFTISGLSGVYTTEPSVPQQQQGHHDYQLNGNPTQPANPHDESEGYTLPHFLTGFGKAVSGLTAGPSLASLFHTNRPTDSPSVSGEEAGEGKQQSSQDHKQKPPKMVAFDSDSDTDLEDAVAAGQSTAGSDNFWNSLSERGIFVSASWVLCLLCCIGLPLLITMVVFLVKHGRGRRENTPALTLFDENGFPIGSSTDASNMGSSMSPTSAPASTVYSAPWSSTGEEGESSFEEEEDAGGQKSSKKDTKKSKANRTRVLRGRRRTSKGQPPLLN